MASISSGRRWCRRVAAGAHNICCKVSSKRKGTVNEVDVHYELCCAQAVLGDEIGLYLDKEFGRGRWVHKKGSPYCKDWNIWPGDCESNSLLIETRLETPIPLSELSQILEAALLEPTRKYQTDQLEKILEELRLSPSSADHEVLKNKTLFELLGREVEHHIRRGVAKLTLSREPTWVSLSSRIVEFRQQNKQSLDQVFDDDSNEVASLCTLSERLYHEVDKTSKSLQTRAQRMKWAHKQNSWTTRMVLRKYDPGFSESKDPQKEREKRRLEKVPLLIYRIMNELFPTLGAGVILIYAALQEQHYYFARVRRDIHDISGFAKFVAKRVASIDMSEANKDFGVHLSLAVVGWALRKNFFDLCQSFRLYSLAYLISTYHEFDLEENEFLAAQSRPKTEADLEAANLKLDRGLCVSIQKLQIQHVPGQLRESSLQLSVAIDDGCEGETANYQGHTASLPLTASVVAGAEMGGTNGSEHLAPNYNPATQNAESAVETDFGVPNEESLFLPSQVPSIDSGYASNVGSQHVQGTTTVVLPSGAITLPSLIFPCQTDGTDPVVAAGDTGFVGAGIRAAASEKRPHDGDNAASKRHRSSAAATTSNSDTSEGSNADSAFTSYTAPRDDNTSGISGDTADPQSDFSSEFCAAFFDGISATSGMVHNGGDGMADGIPATWGMAHTDMPISDEFQVADFSEITATLPSFLSEPQPNGTVRPAEERETQPRAIQDRS